MKNSAKNEKPDELRHSNTGAAVAQNCCEYVDPITKKRCRSTFLLQIDHIKPIWAGGGNELENLQLLCAKHNQLKYKFETGQISLSDQKSPYSKTRVGGVFSGF